MVRSHDFSQMNKSSICFGGEQSSYAAQHKSVSANQFADNANQNCGNMITGVPTTRVAQPPGGASSICLGGGLPEPSRAGRSRIHTPLEAVSHTPLVEQPVTHGRSGYHRAPVDERHSGGYSNARPGINGQNERPREEREFVPAIPLPGNYVRNERPLQTSSNDRNQRPLQTSLQIGEEERGNGRSGDCRQNGNVTVGQNKSNRSQRVAAENDASVSNCRAPQAGNAPDKLNDRYDELCNAGRRGHSTKTNSSNVVFG